LSTFFCRREKNDSIAALSPADDTRPINPVSSGGAENGPERPAIGTGQYTSNEFTNLLTEHHITQSLSRPRQCWDSAVAESFFASLKLGLIDRRPWSIRAQVRAAVFDYVERLPAVLADQ
jgi:transposase InsO family protein